MDGSCYSDNGADDNPISSSSNEAPANPAGMVPLLPQSSKPQANQRVKSKRPEPSGEFLYARSRCECATAAFQVVFNQAGDCVHMWLRHSFLKSSKKILFG